MRKSPLSTIGALRYTPTDISDYTIVGGAAGWIDTDTSAALGVHPDRVYIVMVVAAAGQFAGARAHGLAVQPFKFVQTSGTFFSRQDSAGHIDLYREAANNVYSVMGYFE